MADIPPLRPPYNYAEEVKARLEFQSIFGLAMMEWAHLETTLSLWFGLILGVDEQMGRSVFFSATSFRPKLDMLNASIAYTRMDASVIPALKAAFSKARRYSVFINSMAHGQAIWNMIPQSSTYKQFVMIDGDAHGIEKLEKGITIKQLETAINNFRELRRLTADLFPGVRQHRPDISHEGHRLLIHRLPVEAHSDAPNPNHLPQPPRDPSSCQ